MTASRSSIEVRPAARLGGELRLPGDKSISHRALMLALLADGESTIRGAGDGADIRSTAGIVRALGATVRRSEADAANVDYVVTSRGAGAIHASGHLECGNSGTTMRLFAGILAGLQVDIQLAGDESLARRPMARVIEPLRAMGAQIDGDGPAGNLPPISVVGRNPLRSVDWTTPVASAQVKSAILLAGLHANGTTTVRESVATRDHTERMLRARGVRVSSRSVELGGAVIEIEGGMTVNAHDQQVPGDPSAAAFWLVAGAIHPAAELRLRDVGVNPTRRAVVDILRRMGASIDESPVGAGAVEADGEPIADLLVRSSGLQAVEIEPGDTAAAIDEVPVLCLAATRAVGRTVIRGAGELRHKESDRIAGIVDGLRELGATIEADGDTIVVEGPTRLRGAAVDSLGDHRLAMTFAIAGLVADGQTSISDAGSVAISYPTFFADLERIRS